MEAAESQRILNRALLGAAEAADRSLSHEAEALMWAKAACAAQLPSGRSLACDQQQADTMIQPVSEAHHTQARC